MSADAPLLLAIESASEWLGVAILRGDQILASSRDKSATPASERLLPTIAQLFRDRALAPDAIRDYAVSVGPGSFTGLRVGIATAKGLAFGSDTRVAAVPTLEALALCAPEGRWIVVAQQAQRGELYAAAYRRVAGPYPTEILSARVVTPEALVACLAPALAESEDAVALLGDGALLAEDAMRTRYGDRLQVIPPPDGAPDPAAVGRLGRALLDRGEGLSPADLVPRYLRRAEAEVRRTGEAFES